MKFRLKRIFTYLLVTCIILIAVWSSHRFFSGSSHRFFSGSPDHLKKQPLSATAEPRVANEPSPNPGVHQIDCVINDEYPISCLKGEKEEVYVPFSFLKKYFEVNGKLRSNLGPNGLSSETFSWQHSYSKVFYPGEPYSAAGPYMWFDSYNVETRDRVKYVSAIKHVPVSSQWDSRGHYYPVQICQFGLSHFSKNLTQGKRRVVVIEDGSFNQESWHLINSGIRPVIVKPVISDDGRTFLKIDGTDVAFKVNKRKFNDMTFSIKFKNFGFSFNFTVILKAIDSDTEFKVSYTSSDEEIVRLNEKTLVYGFGSDHDWKHLTRDAAIDLQKLQGIMSKKVGPKVKNMKIEKNMKIDSFLFTGQGLVDEISISSSAHDDHSKNAGDYLVDHQDENGGWSVHVTRKLSNGELILYPGWYSAMAQGQAMSLLTRMFRVTNNQVYLKAAINALRLFDRNSSENGVRTFFMDKFIWFEEYPTTPSSYVLNGFIYSLIGLYDLSQTCSMATLTECSKSLELFNSGIESLKELLPFFDTGSGTVYDLRHFSLKVPPNLARWDYHTTHINQLLHLNTVLNDLHIQTTAKRWISYMKGHRAPHN